MPSLSCSTLLSMKFKYSRNTERIERYRKIYVVAWTGNKSWRTSYTPKVNTVPFSTWRNIYFSLAPKLQEQYYEQYKQKSILTYLLTYLLTYSMEQSPSWEANRFSASQEIPAFHATRQFITVFPEQTTCPYPAPVRSNPYPHIPLPKDPSYYYPPIHILVFQVVSFLRVLPPQKKPVCSSLLPMHATCPAYLILLDLITRIIFDKAYRSLSSSLCSFLHSPVTSSLLGPNILLNTLFWNTLSLRSSLKNKYH